MNRILVWDLPTRLLHWLLVATILGAAGLALTADEEGRVFQTHMLLGLVAAFLVLLRVIWGFVGTRYARFGSFLFGPGALLAYLRAAFTRTDRRHVGHNPGAAYAIYAMLLLPVAVVASGVLLSTREALEELHPVLAYVNLAAIAVHIAGLAWHTIRHRENIALGMLTGSKAGEPAHAIASSRRGVGLVVLALAAGWAWLLVDGHDPRRARVTLFGQTIQLGETDAGQGDRHGQEEEDDD